MHVLNHRRVLFRGEGCEKQLGVSDTCVESTWELDGELTEKVECKCTRSFGIEFLGVKEGVE